MRERVHAHTRRSSAFRVTHARARACVSAHARTRTHAHTHARTRTCARALIDQAVMPRPTGPSAVDGRSLCSLSTTDGSTGPSAVDRRSLSEVYVLCSLSTADGSTGPSVVDRRTDGGMHVRPSVLIYPFIYARTMNGWTGADKKMEPSRGGERGEEGGGPRPGARSRPGPGRRLQARGRPVHYGRDTRLAFTPRGENAGILRRG